MDREIWDLLTLEYDIVNHPQPESVPADLRHLTASMPALRRAADSARVTISASTSFFRGSLHASVADREPRHPFLLRGNPNPPLQRGNFSKQPAFYCADAEVTVVAELLRVEAERIRFVSAEPDIVEQVLSIGEVRLTRNLVITDFSTYDNAFGANVATRMSNRVESLDERSRYFFTASLCQLARQGDADGVAFRSSWDPQHRNLVLFDPGSFYVEQIHVRGVLLGTL